jgi:hypothetical protein
MGAACRRHQQCRQDVCIDASSMQMHVVTHCQCRHSRATPRISEGGGCACGPGPARSRVPEHLTCFLWHACAPLNALSAVTGRSASPRCAGGRSAQRASHGQRSGSRCKVTLATGPVKHSAFANSSLSIKVLRSPTCPARGRRCRHAVPLPAHCAVQSVRRCAHRARPNKGCRSAGEPRHAAPEKPCASRGPLQTPRA